MTKVLGIDTASPTTQVFLAEEDIVEVSLTVPRDRTARELTTTVRSLLQAAGWNLRDIEKIIVNRGPGSLTGIRVGIAFARSLSLALEVPLSGVSGLDALAFAALSEWFVHERPKNITLVAVSGATRGQVFYAEYRPALPALHRISEYVRASVPEFLEHIETISPAVVAGELPPASHEGSSTTFSLPSSVHWLSQPLLPTPESLLMAAKYLSIPDAEPLYLFSPVRERDRA